MSEDLEKRLDAVCESMDTAKTEFDEATKCLVESLTSIHERLENIEKWITSQSVPVANR
jgi:tetrahydromethanopterin S-methyltransferase subunit G